MDSATCRGSAAWQGFWPRRWQLWGPSCLTPLSSGLSEVWVLNMCAFSFLVIFRLEIIILAMTRGKGKENWISPPSWALFHSEDLEGQEAGGGWEQRESVLEFSHSQGERKWMHPARNWQGSSKSLHLCSQHHWPHLSSSFYSGKGKPETRANLAGRRMDGCAFRNISECRFINSSHLCSIRRVP